MIYLDYNATTPIDKRVAEAMIPFVYGYFGNPSSNHILGKEAKLAVETARKQVADLINCTPGEIIFTSGGSESNNTVLKGVAHSYKTKGRHIITSEIEHPAIINPCKYLEKLGFKVSYVPVDKFGSVNPADIEKLISKDTILISIMHSNNEIGTIQPIEEIGTISKKYNVLFHTDASQSVGKVYVDVHALGVDFLSVAGHKLYAPKGVGALYINKNVKIEPLIHGAGHENGMRAGTENIILQVGLGKACEIAKEELGNNEISNLTKYFFNEIKQRYPNIKLNGHPQKKLPNTVNLSFIGYNGNSILEQLNDVAASTGSACHSKMISISPVLKAIGVTEDEGAGAVRFSLGRYTTKEEIDSVLNSLDKILTFKK